jgi:hypothetical protein
MRISIQPKILDPDPDETNADPQDRNPIYQQRSSINMYLQDKVCM